MGRYDRVYGAKYDAGLSRTDIAKRVREDIKAAIKAGELPKGLRTTVKTSTYANGRSIDIVIREIPVGVDLLTYKTDERYPFAGGTFRHSDIVATWIVHLEAILRAYNYDGSDSMSDYYDVNFSGNVRVDWTVENAWKESKGLSRHLCEIFYDLKQTGTAVDLPATLHTLVNDPDAQRLLQMARAEGNQHERIAEIFRLFSVRKAEAA